MPSRLPPHRAPGQYPLVGIAQLRHDAPMVLPAPRVSPVSALCGARSVERNSLPATQSESLQGHLMNEYAQVTSKVDLETASRPREFALVRPVEQLLAPTSGGANPPRSPRPAPRCVNRVGT